MRNDDFFKKIKSRKNNNYFEFFKTPFTFLTFHVIIAFEKINLYFVRKIVEEKKQYDLFYAQLSNFQNNIPLKSDSTIINGIIIGVWIAFFIIGKLYIDPTFELPTPETEEETKLSLSYSREDQEAEDMKKSAQKSAEARLAVGKTLSEIAVQTASEVRGQITGLSFDRQVIVTEIDFVARITGKSVTDTVTEISSNFVDKNDGRDPNEIEWTHAVEEHMIGTTKKLMENMSANGNRPDYQCAKKILEIATDIAVEHDINSREQAKMVEIINEGAQSDLDLRKVIRARNTLEEINYNSEEVIKEKLSDLNQEIAKLRSV